MSRFVVLEHDHPFVHWDFMLETGETLSTWRLLQNPLAIKDESGKETQCNVFRSLAEQLPDHRAAYLDYEGEVSQDRGTVRRLDTGLFVLISQLENQWEFRLEGETLCGFASLSRKHTSGTNKEWEFLLIFDDPEATGEPSQ